MLPRLLKRGRFNTLLTAKMRIGSGNNEAFFAGVEMVGEKTVLVVDDEACFREFTAEALSAAGFLTSVSSDGNEAIYSLELMSFDMAMVDIVMPEKEGVETIIEIKRRWPGCKVVAMAGDGRIPAAEYLRLAVHFGADAILAKPFSASMLLETVKAVFAVDVLTAPLKAA